MNAFTNTIGMNRYATDRKVLEMLKRMDDMCVALDVYVEMASRSNTKYDVCENTWAYNTFLNILGNAARYKGFTDKQAALVIKLAMELRTEHEVKVAREAARAAERAAAEDCPEGRRMISGKIIKTKWQEGPYGDTYKILVKDDRGFIVYLTGRTEMNVGDSYQGMVTITRSDKDAKFGFGKRPSNVFHKRAETQGE